MLYAILAIVLLSTGVSTCNYAQRVHVESKYADLQAQTAHERVELSEANLAAVEQNAVVTEKIRKEADAKRRAAESRYAKTKEELDALKKRQAVPKECVAALRSELAPYARILDGMRGDGDPHAGQGAAPGGGR